MWAIEILEKFKKRIVWREFSESCDVDILTPEIVERFKEYFDLHELSSRGELPTYIYDKYADVIDWKEAINSYDYHNRLNRAFFDKYREYIPAPAFKDSTLWQNIVQEIRKDIENGIRNGE